MKISTHQKRLQTRGRRFCRALCFVTLALCLVSGLAFGVVWQLTPDPLPQVLTWPVSPVLLDNRGDLIHARLASNQEWCLPVPLEEMGDWLPKVLVSVEDKRFYRHAGVDVLALGRAVVQNAYSGRVVSGASTISSQLVRLSMPRERTLKTKILEFTGALKLERSLSKTQILEYYLNRAPFGGPIRGVEAAARMYFGKRAKELSLGEAALLVGLLKGPTAYRPDKNPKAALARRQQIIHSISAEIDFPADLKALALEEPLPKFRPRMPTAAWHFADLAFSTLPAYGGVARSTLDMKVQRLLERVLKERLQRAGGDVTAAGVVVDNRKGAVIAYVGNARFDPVKRVQWVDCAIAPRSPGSTLKPFVYMGAIEAGHIIPESLLADTPLQLGGEAPRNFDRKYRGPVTARTALADSLNTPAVRVMRMQGVRAALTLLRRAGFSFLDRVVDDYGDSLVLGAGEVTVLELARAYAALANLGQDRPLLLLQAAGPMKNGRTSDIVPLEAYGSSLRPEDFVGVGGDFATLGVSLPSGLADIEAQVKTARGESLPSARRLYSREAAFLVADILKDPGRLPFLIQLVQARESAPVAFKTGTSFGLRDAWTAAYSPRYTVVLWFGRAGGGPDTYLIGISMAAPGAIAILRELDKATPVAKLWYKIPPDISHVPVCRLSGAALSPFCPSSRNAMVIRQVWRTEPCTMHVLKDGKSALVWPPELEDYNRKRFAREDLSRRALIVSPVPGSRYILTPGARRHPVPLKAEGVDYPVHWYVGGDYLGRQEREDLPLYWTPRNGEHTLSLLDAQERVASAIVPVTDLNELREEELPLLGD